MQAKLVLADGKVFTGSAFGKTGQATGEILFNNSMTGYQEIMTDPASKDKFVVMTFPLIGNYGTNHEDNESNKNIAKALIVAEINETPSNWRSKAKLSEFMENNNIYGLAGIDTRALTRHIREKGSMKATLTSEEQNENELVKELQASKDNTGGKISVASCEKKYTLAGTGPKLAILDLGVKESFLQKLQKAFNLVVFPAFTEPREILAENPAGIIVAGGTGNSSDLQDIASNLKELIKEIPTLGICIGHLAVAISLGANIDKMKFGHHGANYPIKNLLTNKVTITQQNNDYRINRESLPQKTVQVSHENVNDNTIEGIKHNTLPVYTLGYYPTTLDPNQESDQFSTFVSKLNI